MTKKVAIFGAGATGCYLGAALDISGLQVTLICRPHIQENILANSGITITDYLGNDNKTMPYSMQTQAPDEIFDIVFVTLKCHHLPEAIDDILTLCNKKTAIVFMQNGIGSLKPIQAKLQGYNHYLGITPFNVLQKENATYHKSTEGDFIFAEFDESIFIKNKLNLAGFGCQTHTQIDSVIYGKLLLNLNNAINAIANIPIRQQLKNRKLRKILALAMQEWLDVTTHMGVKLTQFTKVKPHVLPKMLKMPNWVFNKLAARMLDIDPEARSSMWQDISSGKKTEIEFLNQAVVELGQKHHIATPVNSAIVDCIHQLERGKTVTIETLKAAVSADNISI